MCKMGNCGISCLFEKTEVTFSNRIKFIANGIKKKGNHRGIEALNTIWNCRKDFAGKKN